MMTDGPPRAAAVFALRPRVRFTRGTGSA